MEPERSLPHSQATCPYPEPARSSPYPKSHFLHLNIFFPSTRETPKWFISLMFLHQNAVYASPLPHSATCTTRFNVLDFITRKILGEQYRPLSSSLCSFLYSLVTSSLLGPNILLNTLLSNNLRPTFLPQCERPSFTPIQNKRPNYNSVLFPPTSLKLVF